MLAVHKQYPSESKKSLGESHIMTGIRSDMQSKIELLRLCCDDAVGGV